MTVLIVTDPAQDGHLLPVLKELGRRGHEVQIFNPGAYPQTATITVDSTSSGPRASISWEGQSIDLATVGSVWFRRPGAFGLPEELAPKEADWLRGECSALVNGIYENSDALWVSNPHNLRRADLKLLQLRLARQLGFRVPEYTVTNGPERARSFLAEHPDGVIVKTLMMPAILLEDRAGMTYTHLVTAKDAEQLDSVRYGPTFLQALVPKTRDIRVTVIGEEIFPTAIDSMSVADAHIDFRRVDSMDLPHEPVTLPEAISHACLTIVEMLGLRFGAIDLLETPDGDYVFLEINPNGQWYWVELITGQPMARAMADLLERGERERGHGSERARPVSPAQGSPHVLPVGEQTVPLPASVVAAASGDAARLAHLAATRSWLERKRGNVLLHVGDVEDASS
jgi:glutathione synthase/RimK-type ligase-like ATP-grasp enzyme